MWADFLVKTVEVTDKLEKVKTELLSLEEKSSEEIQPILNEWGCLLLTKTEEMSNILDTILAHIECKKT